MDRRALNRTDETDASSSTTISEAAARVDEYFEQVSPPPTSPDPANRLQQWISQHSIILTASSFAERQQAAATNSLHLPYTEIGKSYTGIVYESPGENRALKKAISHQLADNL